MDIQKQISENLFRADLYRILALGFEEPNAENLRSIQGIAKDLLELICDMECSLELEIALRGLVENGDWNTGVLSAEYYRLFGTHVICPSSEGSFQQVERGPIIGDISAFYEAFQMKVIEHQGPPDSIKMELGFMSFMALKTVYALENGLKEEKEIVDEAQKKFLSSHLGRWVEPFVAKLDESSRYPFYTSLARLLVKWVTEDCRNIGASPVPLAVHEMKDDGEVSCSLGNLSS